MSALPVPLLPATCRRQSADGAAATLTIDLSAIADNTRLIADRARGELMAAVKADGFGHGAVDVARTALGAGASALGVTSLAEAIDLRAAGIDAPILSWLNPVDAAFSVALTEDLEIAVPSVDHLDAIIRHAPGTRVHLMIDTGMARDGCPPQLWPQLCRRAMADELAGRVRVVGVMGHLPCADVPSDPSNWLGRQRFQAALDMAFAIGLRPRHHHLAATAATLHDPLSHHTMCRVGAGLVGIDPARHGAPGGTLRPALTLRAPLVEVRQVAAGTPVGYGHRWRAPGPTTLGLLPLGYADGLPRIAGGRAAVSVGGRRARLVGTMSMDMAVVDLGPDSDARPGAVATVFGPGDHGEPTTAEWANWADTIEHEIVTGLGSRVVRHVRTRPYAVVSRGGPTSGSAASERTQRNRRGRGLPRGLEKI